ncbi:MAG: FixH family protein [Pseudomonadota bacterium]
MLANGKFTGWHMTAILVAFFAVVMAVNFTMARMAVSSFGGTVVDNSYVASQKYNRWLTEAAQQDRLGWDVAVSMDANRHVRIDTSSDGAMLDQVTAVGDALHPLGRAADVPLAFAATPQGYLLSTKPLPAGRWNLRLSLRRGADIFKLVEQVQ